MLDINELITKENIKIEDMIYEVRDKQIMFAPDVALMYKTETIIINQVVKRNINRFTESFCFQLTSMEFLNLKSQFVIKK